VCLLLELCCEIICLSLGLRGLIYLNIYRALRIVCLLLGLRGIVCLSLGLRRLNVESRIVCLLLGLRRIVCLSLGLCRLDVESRIVCLLLGLRGIMCLSLGLRTRASAQSVRMNKSRMLSFIVLQCGHHYISMFLTIYQPPDLTTEPATWHFNTK
jgi:hypothetical protein